MIPLVVMLAAASPDSAAAVPATAVRADTPSSAAESRPVIVVERMRTLKNALRSFDARDYAHAEQAAYMVYRAYPGDTPAMLILGAARIQLGKPADAAEVFRSYATYYPLDPWAHFYLGLAYHLAGDRARAIESYHTALLLNPDFVPARANLKQLNEP